MERKRCMKAKSKMDRGTDGQIHGMAMTQEEDIGIETQTYEAAGTQMDRDREEQNMERIKIIR